MYLLKLVLLTFPIIPFLSVLPSDLAQAACVDTDASVQVAIRNQAKAPPQQINSVESNLSEDCFGDTGTTTNTQVYVGNGDQIIQERYRRIEMDTPNAQSPRVNTPNIQTGVGIEMDIPLPLDSLSR